MATVKGLMVEPSSCRSPATRSRRAASLALAGGVGVVARPGRERVDFAGAAVEQNGGAAGRLPDVRAAAVKFFYRARTACAHRARG